MTTLEDSHSEKTTNLPSSSTISRPLRPQHERGEGRELCICPVRSKPAIEKTRPAEKEGRGEVVHLVQHHIVLKIGQQKLGAEVPPVTHRGSGTMEGEKTQIVIVSGRGKEKAGKQQFPLS